MYNNNNKVFKWSRKTCNNSTSNNKVTNNASQKSTVETTAPAVGPLTKEQMDRQKTPDVNTNTNLPKDLQTPTLLQVTQPTSSSSVVAQYSSKLGSTGEVINKDASSSYVTTQNLKNNV